MTSLAFWTFVRLTAGGVGARKRNSPTGGAANRTFLKVTRVLFYKCSEVIVNLGCCAFEACTWLVVWSSK